MYMKKYVISAFLLAFFTITSIAFANTDTFTHYLQKGDTDNEVKTLQQILNSDSETQVAAFGFGSKGQETTFFGELTKQALIKLQKKHSLGTKYGFFTIYTGALDDKTREFLNKYVLEKGLVAKSCGPTNSNKTINREKIESLSEKLKPENLLDSPEDKWKMLNEFYSLSVSTNGTAPYIEKVETSEKDKNSFLPFSQAISFTSGSEMKITGCNFATSTPNTISTTFGKTEVKSKDGTTLVFTPKTSLQDMFDQMTKKMKDSKKDNTLENMGTPPLFITVQNSNGVSNPYQLFMNLK